MNAPISSHISDTLTAIGKVASLCRAFNAHSVSIINGQPRVELVRAELPDALETFGLSGWHRSRSDDGEEVLCTSRGGVTIAAPTGREYDPTRGGEVTAADFIVEEED